jgi:hypothetical protein
LRIDGLSIAGLRIDDCRFPQVADRLGIPARSVIRESSIRQSVNPQSVNPQSTIDDPQWI